MCEYLRLLTEKTLVPDEKGGGHYEEVPYADECTLKNVLCPDCINCEKTKEKYEDHINSTVLAGR